MPTDDQEHEREDLIALDLRPEQLTAWSDLNRDEDWDPDVRWAVVSMTGLASESPPAAK